MAPQARAVFACWSVCALSPTGALRATAAKGPLAALVLRSSELNTPHHVLYAVPSELVSLEPLWTSVMPVSVWPRTSVTSS